LFQSFPQYFDQIAGAENPAEEFIRIERGDDFGWPYCFFDTLAERKVLAPEYGGDGRTRGRCASAKDPIFGFPGHWAPNALLFYDGDQFPDRFRSGVFVTFHGSWNRAPEPQGGYNVTFLPLAGDEASGPYEVFADGFQRIGSRPVGLAQAPDGSLYVSDDAGGRIWRILRDR
jgi:glucose/arabinose dehydrogenase